MVQERFWGNLIRELREKYGVSQRQLAEDTGVNRSTLRSIEAGQSAGDILIIERLLDALGHDLEALDRQQTRSAESIASPLHPAGQVLS